MPEGYPIIFSEGIAPIARVIEAKGEIMEGSYSENFPPEKGDIILEVVNGVQQKTKLSFSRFLRDIGKGQAWGTKLEI